MAWAWQCVIGLSQKDPTRTTHGITCKDYSALRVSIHWSQETYDPFCGLCDALEKIKESNGCKTGLYMRTNPNQRLDFRLPHTEDRHDFFARTRDSRRSIVGRPFFWTICVKWNKVDECILRNWICDNKLLQMNVYQFQLSMCWQI